MKILHIASIENNNCNGVCVVVPQHVYYQSEFADTVLWNIRNIKINCNCKQLTDINSFEDLIKVYGRPDLVVFHEVYYLSYIKISKQVKHYNIPYIIVPHSELTIDAQNKKRIKKTIANLLLFNSFIHSSVSIQCLSNYEMESTKYKVNKILGTNGMSLPTVKKESFRNDSFKFVYIGRLDAYHKGLDLMIKAVSMISEFFRNNNCILYIYGPDSNGRYDNLVKLIKEYNVSDIVIPNHEVIGEMKKSILIDADIFIQTSRFEGMPMGILESLSLGLPCLITKGTTLGDLISEYDAGWVSETTCEDIANVIEKVINDRERFLNKSKNAIELIKKEFYWKTVSKKAIIEYKKILGMD